MTDHQTTTWCHTVPNAIAPHSENEFITAVNRQKVWQFSSLDVRTTALAWFEKFQMYTVDPMTWPVQPLDTAAGRTRLISGIWLRHNTVNSPEDVDPASTAADGRH